MMGREAEKRHGEAASVAAVRKDAVAVAIGYREDQRLKNSCCYLPFLPGCRYVFRSGIVPGWLRFFVTSSDLTAERFGVPKPLTRRASGTITLERAQGSKGIVIKKVAAEVWTNLDLG